ncbi:hypothetical protein UKMH10_2020 [Burkholderia pseudomallei]|nr:hypothetical protein UKMH10_2020 [Burkholderia pseudomallei]
MSARAQPAGDRTPPRGFAGEAAPGRQRRARLAQRK